jgi:hypothetical protein
MAVTQRQWLILGTVFVLVFAVAAWYLAGVFTAPGQPDPSGSTQAAAGIDWGRVLAAAAVVALLATGIVGVLIRLARPEDG